MAVGRSHSPLCEITWTEVVNGAETHSFGLDDPLEFRFGMRVDPALWTVESGSYFCGFEFLRFGTYTNQHEMQGDLKTLPGYGSKKLWLGLRVAKAREATKSGQGLYEVRPRIWFQRFGPGARFEFATVAQSHAFSLALGGSDSGHGSPTLVGGSGNP